MSSLLAAASDLGIFGSDPIGIVIVKVVAILVLLLTFTLFNIWFERRIVSFMQMRIGPNRVGPQGALQSLMDALKLLFKEEIIPKAADRPVYVLAPIISAFTAIFAMAVIPMGPVVSMFGVETPLQVVDFPSSVLFVVAISSIGIYGIVLRRLVLRLHLCTARRHSFVGPDDLVRDSHGPFFRCGLPLRRYSFDLGDHHRARAGLVRGASAAVVPDLRHRHDR